MAQLKTTVFVEDPDTRQTVELDPGTCPEPRLAALVTNEAAWVDGKLPRLRTETKTAQEDGPSAPSDGASKTSSDTGADEEPAAEEKPPTRAAKKTAARKPAAETAAEGTGGQ